MYSAAGPIAFSPPRKATRPKLKRPKALPDPACGRQRAYRCRIAGSVDPTCACHSGAGENHHPTGQYRTESQKGPDRRGLGRGALPAGGRCSWPCRSSSSREPAPHHRCGDDTDDHKGPPRCRKITTADAVGVTSDPGATDRPPTSCRSLTFGCPGEGGPVHKGRPACTGTILPDRSEGESPVRLCCNSRAGRVLRLRGTLF
jgi:hypothetical protein